MRKLMCVYIIVILIISGCSKSSEPIEDARWEGIVTLDDTRFFIHLKTEAQQIYLSIPEMLASDIAVEDARISSDQWSFKVSLGTSTMRFLLSQNQSGFTGKILYDTKSGSVMLQPGRYTVEHRRLEQPKRIGKPVSVATPRGTLYGTFLVPDGEGPFPTVLIIPGSGPTDRDGNSELMVESNDSLWHLARQLHKAGIATLRYDKLGVGESQIEYEEFMKTATFEDFVDDASIWMQYLKTEERASPTGIIGHSEGSLVGLLVAKSFPVDFVVSVAGNGDPIADQMVKQIRRMDSEAADVLEKRLEQIAQSHFEETGNLLVDSFIPLGSERYLQTWMAYNPTEVLRNLEIPVLVVWGDHDERLVGKEDLFGQENMPETVQFVEIPNMGHILRWAESDEDIIRSYKDRTVPLHPEFLETVITFIHEQKKGDI